MDCFLTLRPLLIPCSLGNTCCTFGFLIFIIVDRNSLYNSLYILTERSLKHPFLHRRLGSRCLSLSLSLWWTASKLWEGLSVLAWGQSAIMFMLFTFINIFFFFCCCTNRYVGSWFPNQGWNLCSPQWKHSLDYWATREVPTFTNVSNVGSWTGSPVLSLLNPYYLWDHINKAQVYTRGISNRGTSGPS